MKHKLFIAAIILPFLYALTSLILGNLTFWYDPARDLLSAWNNLSKITLIGPTSGIPGIFYGPYWIWLLSLGELVSRNPLVVTFIAATIPYCLIFPFVWFKFSRFFDRTTLIVGWLLFALGQGYLYATQLWNPYPAPLLTLVVLYLLVRYNFQKLSWQAVLASGALGFFLGMLVTFHISFGIALSLGVALFLLGDALLPLLRKKKTPKVAITKLVLLVVTGSGGVVAFLPTLLFEVRHGFNQIHALLNTFTHYGAVVTTTGLSKYLIFDHFFHTFGTIFHIETQPAMVLVVLTAIAVIIMQKKHPAKFAAEDKRIIGAVLTIIFSVALIYFTARNPVWSYHFIGVEIPMLIGVALLTTKFPLLKKGAILLLGYVLIATGLSLYTQISTHTTSVLYSQKELVQTIVRDAKDADYTVFTYSPSIYSFEYAYLFRWLANKDIPYDPGQNPTHTDVVYLIVPIERNPEVEDFINYRGKAEEYTIVKTWEKSGTEVIKKEKHASK